MFYRRTRARYGALALVALLAGCGGGGDTAKSPVTEPFYPAAEDEWELVWSDEFDGSALDGANWEAQVGDGSEFGLDRWGNNEQQWYLAENATVADGLLTITAKSEEVVAGFPYTSARLRTAEKFDFKYGRVETRIKAAAGQGLWSAAWMLGTNSPYGTWAASGEIDIMEVVNSQTENERAFLTLHHGFPWPLNQIAGTDVEVVDSADEFHTYAIEWEGDEIRWFVDGEHLKTVGADHYYSYYWKDATEGYTSGGPSAPFDSEFHLLLNLAVGGNLPGAVESGDIPSDMVVDYVRVYSCSYNESDGDGCNSNVDRTLERPDAQEPFEASFALYTDGADALSWLIGGEDIIRELAVNSFYDNSGSLTFMETDIDGRGTVIDVTTSGGGNISINAVDGKGTSLFGFGNNPNWYELHAGEIKFDMYIDSSATNVETGSFAIKMDSGFPALGFKSFNYADLPHDEWFSVSVMVNDLLFNSGDQPLDTSNIVSFFVFEPSFTEAAHVWIDNVELACGHPSRNGCGIRPPGGDVDGALVPVFSDGEVGALWDRGVCAYDTTVNGDYCGDGATANHVTWTVTDSGDAEIGAGLNVNFGTSGASGLVFFGSAAGVDLSDFAAEGKLKFDLRVDEATKAAGVYWKVDCFYPCGTGDQALDLTDYTAGTWGSFEVLVSDLQILATPPGEGLDVTRVNAGLVLFPAWGSQGGLFLEVANVRYEVEGAAPPAPGFAGVWVVPSEAGAIGVGPTQGDISWWNGDDGVVVVRECFYDDEYTFGLDGTFSVDQQNDTWIEAWQGGSDSCAAPVAPHDNSVPASYVYDAEAGTLTLNGQGAYVGVAKAVNGSELAASGDAPASVIYQATLQEDGSAFLDVNSGPDDAPVWWRSKIIKIGEPPAPDPVIGTWKLAPVPGSLGVGPTEFAIDWWNADAGVIAVRTCLFDDTFTLAPDGTFTTDLQDETWIEAWQGGADSCDAPVAPHDGATPATWEYDEDAGTLTLNGQGAYMGLSKAVNGAELAFPGDAPASLIYNAYPQDNGDLWLTIDAGTADAPVWWNTQYVRE